MNVKWFIPLIFLVLLSCDNDDYPTADIPSVVLNKFRTSFPDASEVKWKQTEENYEVEYEVGNIDSEVMITASGDILKLKKDISVDSLPQEVQESLAGKFGREKIDDPELISEDEKSYYQVEIRQFLFDKEIVVAGDGTILDSVAHWD